jgi:hypothetical protein
MDCITTNCKSQKIAVSVLLEKKLTDMCKLIKKVKTIKDIEKNYKEFEKIKKTIPYKNLDKCEKEHCSNKKYQLKQIAIIKSGMRFILKITKNTVEKYPFINDLTSNINLLLDKPKLTQDEIFKLGYYAIVLSCLMQ